MLDATALRSVLPDPEHSRAVLVGTASYDSLAPLPAVANNLSGLRDALADEELWGLPGRHCTMLVDPPEVRTVLDAIHDAAVEATDTLVIYLAGHGLLMGDNADLYLALTGSDRDRPHWAVSYEDIRRAIVRNASAHRKVMILDCCYSGQALKGHMTGEIEMADVAGIEGTYLMTATRPTATALAPPGARYTAFTGALINRLLVGVPNGPELLDMQTLYYNVRNDLRRGTFPVPQQRIVNEGARIALARNRAFVEAVQEGTEDGNEDLGRPPEPVQPTPAATDWTLPLLASAPDLMLQHIGRFREDGRDEEISELLSAIGLSRDPQGLVAIMNRLQTIGDTGSVVTLIGAAARRPAADLLDVVATCRALDRPKMAFALLDRAGAGSADAVAGLAQALAGNGALDDLRLVLDAALTAAQRANSLLDLVGVLWAAGLREEVDLMLQRRTAGLSGAQALDIADELRSAGRDRPAFVLYRAAASALAERGPDAVARIVRAMAQADRTDDARRVAESAIATRPTAVGLVGLATALAAADQQSMAEQALARAARMPSDEDVLDAAFLLVSAGDEPAALELCGDALAGRAGDRVVAFIEALRHRGRPLDAKALLLGAASRMAAAEIVEFGRTAGEADRTLVIGHLLDQRQAVLPMVVREALAGNTADVVDCVARLVSAQRPGKILAVLADLSATLTAREVGAVFDPVLRTVVVDGHGGMEPIRSLRDPTALDRIFDILLVESPVVVRPVIRPVLRLLDTGALCLLAASLDRRIGERPGALDRTAAPALRPAPRGRGRARPGVLNELAVAAVDALAERRGRDPLRDLAGLIWRDGPAARRAAWRIAMLLKDPRVEAVLGTEVALPTVAMSIPRYDWLWEPFGGAPSLRVVMGRVGCLIDATDTAEVPAEVGNVDPRIALGLATCAWGFGQVDVRGADAPATRLIGDFVIQNERSPFGAVKPSTSRLRDAFAAAMRGDDEAARAAAVGILTAGGVRPPFPMLLQSLPTAVLAEAVCQLHAGWVPGGSAQSEWRTIEAAAPAPPRRVWDLLAVVVAAAVIGPVMIGLLRLCGALFGFWGDVPDWWCVLSVLVVLIVVSGVNADRAQKQLSVGEVTAIGLFLCALTFGGIGLIAVAGWIGVPMTVGLISALAVAIPSVVVARLRTRALTNGCRTILERDQRFRKQRR